MLLNVSERCQLEGASSFRGSSGLVSLHWLGPPAAPPPHVGKMAASILSPHPLCPTYSHYLCCYFICHSPSPKLCISNNLWVSSLHAGSPPISKCVHSHAGAREVLPPCLTCSVYHSLTVLRLHPQSPLKSPPPSSHTQATSLFIPYILRWVSSQNFLVVRG